MGTTLHSHIEVKKDGIWYHFAAPAVERDYLVFAAISGERLDSLSESLQKRVKPQASVKGLPNDLSLVTRVSYEQDKGLGLHGEGVLTSTDIKNLQEHLWEFDDRNGYRLDLEWNIFRTYISSSAIHVHKGWDDARIVFWYD